jgi:GNAT superfamily N-acetyltransferase
MIEITRAQLEMLAAWFQPETPGPIVAAHVMHTGVGRAWVDRWPDVRAIAVETNYNFVLTGDPVALEPDALRATVAGFVAAPPTFLPLLEETFPTLEKWPRMIASLPSAPVEPPPLNAASVEVRRLCPADGDDLDMLSAEAVWVTQTWGGGKPLARSGYGWGAWDEGHLAAVACTFFLGIAHEDIGVVTEAEYRGQGLSTACTFSLCQDIIARGRTPTWATSTDNIGSWRVAEKLGFVHQYDDWLYVVGREIPKADA